MFILLTSGADSMSTNITSIVSVFTSLFSSAWTMISGNWFLLASIGIPLVAGLLFAIISFFKR